MPARAAVSASTSSCCSMSTHGIADCSTSIRGSHGGVFAPEEARAALQRGGRGSLTVFAQYFRNRRLARLDRVGSHAVCRSVSAWAVRAAHREWQPAASLKGGSHRYGHHGDGGFTLARVDAVARGDRIFLRRPDDRIRRRGERDVRRPQQFGRWKTGDCSSGAGFALIHGAAIAGALIELGLPLRPVGRFSRSTSAWKPLSWRCCWR